MPNLPEALCYDSSTVKHVLRTPCRRRVSRISAAIFCCGLGRFTKPNLIYAIHRFHEKSVAVLPKYILGMRASLDLNLIKLMLAVTEEAKVQSLLVEYTDIYQAFGEFLGERYLHIDIQQLWFNRLNSASFSMTVYMHYTTYPT